MSSDPVLAAILEKDVKTLRSLVKTGHRFNDLVNERGQTVVHVAAEAEYFPALEVIFSQWKDGHNSVDDNGMSCLHAACMSGNKVAVCNLIKNNINNLDGNAGLKDSGLTPLHLAIKFCRTDVVKVLLTLGDFVNVGRADARVRTPLHLACSIPESMIEAVLPNLVGTHKQPDRLYLARASKFQSQMLQIFKLLLQHKKIDVNAKDDQGDTPVAYVFRDYSFSHLESKLQQGTLDHRIACRKFAQIRKAIVKRTRQDQKTKLRMLLEHSGFDVHDYPRVLHHVLEDVKRMRELRELWLPLFDDRDHVEMIDQVLQLNGGICVDALNFDRESALQVAVKALSADIVDLLLSHGAKVDSVEFSLRNDPYFYYPDILPSLEATENLLRIVDSLSKAGFEFDLEAKLVIVKFFTRNNANCNFVDPVFELAAYKLTNLLELGCPENVKSSLARVSDLRSVRYSGGLVSNQVIRYLVKIKDTGFRLNEEFEDFLRSYVTDSWNNLEQRELDSYKKEADRLETWTDKNGAVIMDILRSQNYDRIYSVVKNNNIYETLESEDFKRQFPLSVGFVKGFFAKSLVRRFFVNTSMDCIREIIGQPLPDPCCKRIADFLCNEDLWRVCLATKNTRDLSDFEKSMKNITLSE